MNLDLLRRQLVLDEGERLKPYKDTVGKITIGIGHNLTDCGISHAISDALFREDAAKVMADLTKHLPWWSTLDDTRQRVIFDLCFNLGIEGLLAFTNMLRCIQAARWPAAADALEDSRWFREVGNRGPRLVAMLETGQDPPELLPRQ